MTDQPLEIARRVDGDRISARLEELARIHAGGPGVTRVGYSALERAAMDLATAWAAQAGAAVAWDEWGNCFLLVEGREPEAPVAMAGSHLDTVVEGGRYDGALGVVAALETLALAAEAGYRPRRSLELVIWACEEPIRFVQGRVGSQLFAGKLAPADLTPNEPDFDPREWTGDRAPQPRRPSRAISAYLELHIEQGRQLETAGIPVGVVTGIAGLNRAVVDIHGRADHSGATPMPLRADALCAAAEIILAFERLGQAEAPHTTVATVGRIEVRPNAVNVVPGEVRLTPEARSLDAASTARAMAALRAETAAVAARRGVPIDFALRGRSSPVVFPPEMVDLVEGAARDLGNRPPAAAERRGSRRAGAGARRAGRHGLRPEPRRHQPLPRRAHLAGALPRRRPGARARLAPSRRPVSPLLAHSLRPLPLKT